MTADSKARADAALRISKARAALVLTAPFFASLTLRLNPVPVVNHPVVQTMGVDGVSIYYNPAWVNRKSHHELVGVVAHEGMHCAFLHPFRRQHRDHGKWNRACDHAINLLLKQAGFQLPKEGLMDPQYAGMTAEAIYTRLPDEPAPPDGCYGGMGSVEDAPGEDGGAASLADMDALAAQWEVAVLQAAQAAKNQGKLPAGLEMLVESIRAPKLDWRAVLREFVRTHARGDYSWRRPNSRHLAGDFYFPSLYDETVGPLVLGVDTSGSVGQNELDAVCDELNGVLAAARPESVAICYCDTRAYEGEVYGPDDWPVSMKVKGRGGTCLAPVWDFVRDKQLQPVCAILTTDMELHASDLGKDPGCPVLILTTGRLAPMDGPVPFGTVIELRLDQ